MKASISSRKSVEPNTFRMRQQPKTERIQRAETGRDDLRPALSQYQGNPIICLNPESKFGFQFGLKKAEMILACLPAIQTFVKSQGAKIN